MTTGTTPGITDMAVTVRVLTVDGTRRMSHKFFEQIPNVNMLTDGELRPGAVVWGYVTSGNGGTVVGTVDGQLVTMGRDDATWGVYSHGGHDAVVRAGKAFSELIAGLPQLYLGG